MHFAIIPLHFVALIAVHTRPPAVSLLLCSPCGYRTACWECLHKSYAYTFGMHTPLPPLCTDQHYMLSFGAPAGSTRTPRPFNTSLPQLFGEQHYTMYITIMVSLILMLENDLWQSNYSLLKICFGLHVKN